MENYSENDEYFGHVLTAYEYDGHIFFHVRLHDLPDNAIYDFNGLTRLMLELDLIEKLLQENGIDRVNALFHCNGGLGRSSSLLVSRLLWKAVKAAASSGIGLVWAQDKQTQKMVDNKLNLAAVFRNIFINGYFARSTFCQSPEQIWQLAAFGQGLAGLNVTDTVSGKQQNILFDKTLEELGKYTENPSNFTGMKDKNILFVQREND
jgi:hypothetical protein